MRETFQDRAEALLEYEILSDAYDAVISAKGRSVATTDPECLAAEARREEAKATYDAIVNRMRDELPRFHAEYGAGLSSPCRDSQPRRRNSRARRRRAGR